MWRVWRTGVGCGEMMAGVLSANVRDRATAVGYVRNCPIQVPGLLK